MTEEKSRQHQIYEKYFWCVCDQAFNSRGKIDPYCIACDERENIESAMHESYEVGVLDGKQQADEQLLAENKLLKEDNQNLKDRLDFINATTERLQKEKEKYVDGLKMLINDLKQKKRKDRIDSGMLYAYEQMLSIIEPKHKPN